MARLLSLLLCLYFGAVVQAGYPIVEMTVGTATYEGRILAADKSTCWLAQPDGPREPAQHRMRGHRRGQPVAQLADAGIGGIELLVVLGAACRPAGGGAAVARGQAGELRTGGGTAGGVEYVGEAEQGGHS